MSYNEDEGVENVLKINVDDDEPLEIPEEMTDFGETEDDPEDKYH